MDNKNPKSLEGKPMVSEIPMERRRSLWIEALRSGDYKQCTGYLQSIREEHGIGYCCLGVACEVYIKCGGDLKTEFVHEYVNYGKDNQLLPRKVKEWLGIKTTDGEFINEDGENSRLTDTNDGGATFEEIARIIEAAPEGLFNKNGDLQ
jgi:hypothetical protein